VLALAPATALRVFAGKTSGCHALPQAQINALLVAHAARGRRVVRLKGGDPFVFGRGGEEAEALAAHGIPVEVVPGVSAAIAVPAAAGIPLTHRGLASSFAVVTGHEDATKRAPGVDWARLATAADTLVILMGLGRLSSIVAALLGHGRPPSTPVALIRHGTTPVQRTIVGTLDDIARRARAAALAPPVVIVIGEVVALRDRLPGWHSRGHRAGAETGHDPRTFYEDRDGHIDPFPCAPTTPDRSEIVGHGAQQRVARPRSTTGRRRGGAIPPSRCPEPVKGVVVPRRWSAADARPAGRSAPRGPG
jgi:uroporphyrin-III C-methyltransferase